MTRQIQLFIISLLASASTAYAQDFTAQDIKVENRQQGVTLAGTLTVPPEGKPKAAIILASGSGAQDRDEEILGHRPFKVIAEHLSGRGYAVLRMDDRGTGESEGDASATTLDDYVADISCAIATLDSCLESKIPTGIIGHSEGGSAAIKSAVSERGCDFIVTLGAPAWRGDSIVMSQARAMAEAMSGKWDGEQLERRLLDMAMSPTPAAMLRPAIYMEIANVLGEMAKLPAVQEQISAQVDVMCGEPYRTMLRYDPAEDIAKVDVPWLAINGELDMQVLPGNLKTISRLSPKAMTMSVPAHNHLMQECVSGMVTEYQGLGQSPSADILDIISSWLDGLDYSAMRR